MHKWEPPVLFVLLIHTSLRLQNEDTIAPAVDEMNKNETRAISILFIYHYVANNTLKIASS